MLTLLTFPALPIFLPPIVKPCLLAISLTSCDTLTFFGAGAFFGFGAVTFFAPPFLPPPFLPLPVFGFTFTSF